MGSVLNRLKAAVNAFRFPGQGGTYGGSQIVRLPGRGGIDYAREVGEPLTNSIVWSCLQSILTGINEAPIRGVRRGHKGWTPDPRGACQMLLDEPSDAYAWWWLQASLIQSLLVYGNAYLVVVPTSYGLPRLYRVAASRMKPVWPEDGSKWIGGYEYQVDGRKIVYPPEQVIHLRYPAVSPANDRLGYSPLNAVLKEVYSDNEATIAQAALMNQPLVGGIVSPAPGKDGSAMTITPNSFDDLKKVLRDKATGDYRGEVIALPFPFTVSEWPQFRPDEFDWTAVHRLPEERVCAALGVPPIIAGMGAGLDRATYSNYKEAREQFTEQTLVPLWITISNQLTAAFAVVLGINPARERVEFDLSGVRALQPDLDALANRQTVLVGAGIMTIDEARAEWGLEPLPKAEEQPEEPEARSARLRLASVQVLSMRRGVRALGLREKRATRPSWAPTGYDQAAFDSLHSEVQERLSNLVQSLASGDLTADEMGDRVYDVLRDGHAVANYMGRRHAGDLADFSDEDWLIGRGRADIEGDFLQSFLSDIKNGRYTQDGALRADLIVNRLRLYGNGIRESASIAWAEQQTSQIEWVRTADESCGDCDYMAGLSPFEPDELFTHPGAGDLACRRNCKCYLRNEDGNESHKLAA